MPLPGGHTTNVVMLPPDLAADIRDLARRIGDLERGQALKYGATTGAPTDAAPDGTVRLDATNGRLYVRIGGAWKSTALT